MNTHFDEIITSAIPLEKSGRPASFAELIFDPVGAEDCATPILLGWLENRMLSVSLGTFRHAILGIIDQLERRGIAPGDTVCLLRLPRTSEALVTTVYAALSAWGVRVFLPMYLELDRFEQWMKQTGAKAVLWSAYEVRELGDSAGDQAHLKRLSAMAANLGLPTYCLYGDLGIPALLTEECEPGPAFNNDRVAELMASTGRDTECLVLTTSGSSGWSKLVRYQQQAFLLSCESWAAAGMFSHERLGGRCLNLLFGHSMGIRAFWNAVWTRQALCLVTPEWFLEHPERARALLLKMQPEHVTGGPATYRALLELARVFPEMKDRLLKTFRCVVSSGAAFDPALSKRIEDAVGLRLENAFGTTETMQITSTLVPGSGPSGPGLMGSPLPGVRLGLQQVADQGRRVYRLFVSSPFGSSGYLGNGEPPPGEWFATGDLVERTADGLVYLGREEHDFFKDGFGVKIPQARLDAHYAGLAEDIDHVACFPLQSEPGLAAVLFMKGSGTAEPGATPLTDTRVLDRLESLLLNRHERLFDVLEEFEFRHLTVSRFACIRGAAPRTIKGNIERESVVMTVKHLLDRLTGAQRNDPAIRYMDREKFTASAYARLVSPALGGMMRLVRFDKHYISGSGDVLTYRDRGKDVAVVDFVGGFGGNLFGHRHPELVAEARAFVEGDGVFMFDQGSRREHESELARALALRVGESTGRMYVTRFGCTGSEAVEMALAHAMLEWRLRIQSFNRDLKMRFGASHPQQVAECVAHNQALLAQTRPRVLAIADGFHGLSLGARSVSSYALRRDPFASLMGIVPIFVPPDGEVDLESIVARETVSLHGLTGADDAVKQQTVDVSRIIAAIAEPILGEGGVKPVNRDFLKRLGRYPFPLVLDEIQAGFGRTGTFLASEGIPGDYYLFAKALGGGIAKISALLVDQSRYIPDFDEQYSSTFSGDAFSCKVAARALSLVDEEDVPARARRLGEQIRGALEKVQKAFPGVIADVRGRGLLIGVEFDPSAVSHSNTLRTVAERGLLGYLAAAYLLNEHQVRVMPTLSAPHTVRVQPSVKIRPEQISQLAEGLRAFCQAVTSGDTCRLVSFMVRDDTAFTDSQKRAAPVAENIFETQEPAPNATRVAFLSHLVFPEREMALFEPSLANLAKAARRALFHRFVTMLGLKPTVGFARNMFDDQLYFLVMTLPVDASILEFLHRGGYRDLITHRIQEAVDMAAGRGAKVVSLGGYTSILTRDGTTILPPPGVRVTSGNTFTVAVGARRLLNSCDENDIDPGHPDTCLAVVGASGNIGAGLTLRLTTGERRFHRVALVGHDVKRLQALRDQVLAQTAGGEAPVVTAGTDLGMLRDCNAIAIATNTNEPIVFPHHLNLARRTVIADVSVPSAVSRLLLEAPEVRTIPLSGTVAVPGDERFIMSSHTLPGTVFCCAAEAMLLGLAPEETADLPLVGKIDAKSVAVLDRLAERLGFYRVLGEGGFKVPESP